MGRRLLLISLLLWTVTGPARAQSRDATQTGDATLTRDATVVIVTGVPGDVESESTYQAQLGRLLEILGTESARPRRVVVLCDAGPSGCGDLGGGVDVRVSGRETFLALADELAGIESHLVVFAWGHGGRIRDTPVFHVRGPRLSPDDFGAFADKVAVPSSWVLFFRGSGAFARALRGPGREVLSSENEVVFRSDPVGVDLVLEILRRDPGTALAALGEELGRDIHSWYEEQHLARQEEPTLWTGDEPPRLLAAAPEEGEADAMVLAEAEPSSVWDDLPAIGPDRYPGASAVVLRRNLRYVLGESPVLTHEVDEQVLLRDPEGSHHGDLDLAYDPPGEKITFLDLEIRLPDGTLERLDPDTIRDATPPALPEYRPPTRKIFSFPRIGPGAVVRVHYRRTWQRFPLPHVPLEIPIAGELPILESRVEVRAARDATLSWTFNQTAVSGEPEATESSYGTTRTWTFRDIAPVADEVLTAPQSVPTLLVSTFPSWGSFSDWYRRLIQLADEVTPEIEAKARELTAGLTDDRDKVVALYNFVTGLRYVAVPFGVNSHRPHAAANVLRNRYGDCKDKANLLNTLLRAVDIRADLVLVPRFSQAYDDVPGLGFNHAISRIELDDGDGGPIWVDATDEVARFGLLPPGDPGRRVLVVREGVAGLTRLPRPRAEDHRLEMTTTVDLTAEDDAVDTTLEARSTGYADYALRVAARAAAGQPTTRPVLREALRPTSGVFEMSGQEHTSSGDLGHDFGWRATGRWSGLVSFAGAAEPGDRRLVRAPFWLPSEWDAALHDRRHPLFVNQGYPLMLHQEITFTVPMTSNWELPPRRYADSGPAILTWSLEWRRAGPDRVVAVLDLALESGELDHEASATFQRQLRRLLQALGSVMVSIPN